MVDLTLDGFLAQGVELTDRLHLGVGVRLTPFGDHTDDLAELAQPVLRWPRWVARTIEHHRHLLEAVGHSRSHVHVEVTQPSAFTDWAEATVDPAPTGVAHEVTVRGIKATGGFA